MLTEQAINDFKDFLDNNIAYAKVTIDNTVSDYIIHRKERTAEGKVAVYIQITPQASSTVTVKKVELYNGKQQLWVEKEENIVLNQVQEGVLYRFIFDFREEEVSNV